MARLNFSGLNQAANEYARIGPAGLKSRVFPQDMVPRGGYEGARGAELQAALRQMPNFRNLPPAANIQMPANALTPYEKETRRLKGLLQR